MKALTQNQMPGELSWRSAHRTPDSLPKPFIPQRGLRFNPRILVTFKARPRRQAILREEWQRIQQYHNVAACTNFIIGLLFLLLDAFLISFFIQPTL